MARVTGCRSSVDRSPGLTLTVPRRRFHPPSSSRGFTSVYPPPKLPVEYFLLASKSLHFISKSRNVPVPPTSSGRRRPRPQETGSARGHAQRSLPRGRKPEQAAKGKRGADRRWRRAGRTGGSRHQAPPPPHTTDSRAPQCPSRVPAPAGAGSRWPYLHQQPEQQRRHPAEPAAHGSREDGPKPGCTASSGPVRTPGRAGGLWGYEPTPAEGRTASRRSSRTCQAALAARPRSTSRARARGLGARKVCGARCGARRQRGWVRRLPDVFFPGGRLSCLTSIVLGRFL